MRPGAKMKTKRVASPESVLIHLNFPPSSQYEAVMYSEQIYTGFHFIALYQYYSNNDMLRLTEIESQCRNEYNGQETISDCQD